MNELTLKPENILPHRGRMLLIDRIAESDGKTYAIAEHDARPERLYFDGHFPDHPIVPGMLIVEMMFQTAGVLCRLIAQGAGLQGVRASGRAINVKNAVFLKEVAPGSTIRIRAEKKFSLMQYTTLSAEASVDGETVCKAELTVLTHHE